MLGRQHRLDRRIAVARVHGHARIVGEEFLERRGFLRLQLTGGQPVLLAQGLGHQ